MKKLFLTFFAITALFVVSCNKDQKINKQMDGEWNITKFANQTPPAGFSYVAKFTAGKKGAGTYTFTATYGAFSDTQSGTYTIKDEKMTIVDPDTTQVLTITEHTKTSLKFTDGANEVTEMTKK